MDCRASGCAKVKEKEKQAQARRGSEEGVTNPQCSSHTLNS